MGQDSSPAVDVHVGLIVPGCANSMQQPQQHAGEIKHDGEHADEPSWWFWAGLAVVALALAGVALYFLWRLSVYVFHVASQFVQDNSTGFIVAGVILGGLLIAAFA